MSLRRTCLPLLLTLCGFSLLYVLWNLIDPGIVLDPATGLRISDGSDFLNYWAGPRLAVNNIMTLFAGEGYEAALRELYAGEFNSLRWSYPLHSLFFYRPFSLLSYDVALLVWTLSGLIAFLLTACFALPLTSRRAAVPWIAVSPIVLVELITRQNGFFIGAGALGVLLLLQHQRPILAGILLGCLTIKPQLFILWPIMLLMDRQWRCIAAAAFTAALLIGVSFLIHGAAAWQEFFAVVPALQWHFVNDASSFETRRFYQLMMPGVMTGLRILHAPDMMVTITQLLVSGTVLVGSVLALSRPLSFAERAFILATASLLITPYAFNYDMTLFTVAVVLLWVERASLTISGIIIGGLAYLLPLLVYILNVIDLPLGSIVLAMAFFGVVRDACMRPKTQPAS